MRRAHSQRLIPPGILSRGRSGSYQGWEARAAVSSAPTAAHTLQLSDSEELDAGNARDTEDSPPQSRAYGELVEVVRRAVESL